MPNPSGSQRKSKPRRRRPKRRGGISSLVGLLVSLAGLIFGGGIFWRFYSIPSVQYAILPSYTLSSGTFSAVIIENRGQATARNLNARITSQSTIKEVRIESIEEYTSEGGQGEKELILRLNRMVPGASLTAYLLTEGPTELTVTGTAEDSMISRGSGPQNTGLILGSGFVGFVLGVGLVFGIQYLLYVTGRL